MRHFLLLVNPSAGGTDSPDDPAASDPSASEDVRLVRQRLGEVGTVEIVEIGDVGDVTAATANAAPGTTVVVVGGDGTLHRVVNAMMVDAAGTSWPFGLIPAGTGNDFANGMGLSEDAGEAADAIASNEPRPLDLIRFGDGGPAAVNAAHIGIGVQAAQKASGLKDHLGKLAYPAGAVSAAVGFEPLRVSLRIDGEVVLEHAEVAMLGLCNGPLVGGGTALCPPADQADGWMDVVVMLADNRTGLAATTAALLRGSHLDRDDVLHQRARAVEVTVDGVDRITWNVDGEFHERPAAVGLEVAAGAWRLRA